MALLITISTLVFYLLSSKADKQQHPIKPAQSIPAWQSAPTGPASNTQLPLDDTPNHLSTNSQLIVQSPAIETLNSSSDGAPHLEPDIFALFDDLDEAQKVEYLDQLIPGPSNMQLLEAVIHSDQPPAVKITAIGRMQQYDAINSTELLLTALDDSAPEVSVIALNTLAAQADESLLSRIKEKMFGLPDGTIRNFYLETIDRIEIRLTLGYSDLTRQ
ncbi:MAG TPA: hypothetical protein PKD17_17730 [Cellvibrionaceae bacterium]|nr:hypothetical protein [Cellvibrionaceae bacterium]HMW73671.1 hypothetical protein [Cellvibrionaceae bacterium]